MTVRIELTRLGRSEDGAVAILWAISLVVVFGFAALAFDVGRLSATQSELQSFADNVALAAAGELDGKSDALTRANAAAANLIDDTQTFADGGQALGSVDYTLTFYRELPASDLDPMDPSDITTDPAQAVYAEVIVQPRSVGTPFAAATNALLGLAGGATATVGATAVAGYTQEACDITPLMFCLPPGAFHANDEIGTMIRLRGGGSGSAWGPGDFGFLDPSQADLGATCSGLNGAQLIACLVGAEQNVTQCYTQRGVNTEPGQKVGIEDAIFNIRFDIYKSTMNGKKNDPDYPPAPNVISGLRPAGGGSCIGQNEATAYPDTIPLPRDDCFAAGTCTRWGDGTWDYATYIDTNHGNGNGVLDAGEDSHLTAFPVDPKYAGTRYETYLREIAYGDSVAGGAILSGQGWETGRPQCSSNMSARPERRVVIAAGIDCVTNPVNGNEVGVPVEEFFEVFLTEPVGDDGNSPPTLDLWVEVIGSAGGDGYSSAGPGGIFRDVVQLYR